MDVYDKTLAAWREASERGDVDGMVGCLAEDVVAISPLTAVFRFEGRPAVAEMLRAAYQCIHDIRYHTEVGEGDTRAVFFRARAGREPVEEAELLRLGEDGLIREVTFFGRPLPALTQVMTDIAPHLLRAQGRPTMAVLLGLATRPLAAMTRMGERRLVPLAAPGRRKTPPATLR